MEFQFHPHPHQEPLGRASRRGRGRGRGSRPWKWLGEGRRRGMPHVTAAKGELIRLLLLSSPSAGAARRCIKNR